MPPFFISEKGIDVDEIILRRLRHLQRLEENHHRDFEERFGTDRSHDDARREALRDAMSADWNKKHSATPRMSSGRPLPRGWRKEHWKTLQVMAADFAGAKVPNRREAVRALELYEAELPLPPAA